MPKKSTFAYDVFISYSHRNKDWVRMVLLPRLEKAKLKVFIDFRDFKVGAASIKEMERGVTKSRKTLVVLTPEYVQSDWANFEILMTQTLSPANRDLRIVPVLRKKCTLPVSIGYMNYVNLANRGKNETEWQRLFDGLGKSMTPSSIKSKPGHHPVAPNKIKLKSPPKILVVDDQTDVQKTIGGYLEDAGYEVYVAADEDAAFILLRREKINFAIIDIKLHETPDDESGLNLANAIYSLAPSIQMIILSGSIKPKHIIKAFKDFGVVDYIVKTPGWEDRLLEAIRVRAAIEKSSQTSL